MSAALEVIQSDPRIQVIVEDDDIFLDLNAQGTYIYPNTTVLLDAGDTIPGTYNVVFLSGDGGHVTLTSTPTIALGTCGQVLWLVGTDDAATVTIQDVSALPGSLLSLEYSRNVTLGANDVCHLICTGTAWLMAAMSDNA